MADVGHVNSYPSGRRDDLVVSYYHSTSTTPLKAETLHSLLDKRAVELPDKEAYVFVDEVSPRQAITFVELKTKTEQLAAALVEMTGLRHGDRVAVLALNCLEFILLEFALSRIGVILVKIHMVLKQGDDVMRILNITGCRGIFVQPGQDNFYFDALISFLPELAEHDPSSNEALDCVEVPDLQFVATIADDPYPGAIPWKNFFKPDFDRESLLARQAKVDFDTFSTIFLTSGSTGFPKVVLLTHYNICNMWMANLVIAGLSESDRYLSERPMTHPVGICSPAVELGLTMVLAKNRAGRSTKQTAEFMCKVIEEEKITAGQFFTYILHDLLVTCESGKYNLETLKVGFAGGQCVPKVFMRKGLKYIPNIIQIYGSTEMGNLLCTRPEDDLHHKLNVTGLPLPHVEAKVVGVDGVVQPVNEPGELYFRSPKSFICYWGDLEKTMNAMSSQRWFKTDDMAVMDEKGYVKILGRKTEVINQAGFKTYPVEIERPLLEHPSIGEAVVVGVPDERLGERICACVKPKAGAAITVEELKQYCEDIFLGADNAVDNLGKRPKYHLVWDSFPVKMGKINRSAIKAQATEKLIHKSAILSKLLKE